MSRPVFRGGNPKPTRSPQTKEELGRVTAASVDESPERDPGGRFEHAPESAIVLEGPRQAVSMRGDDSTHPLWNVAFKGG